MESNTKDLTAKDILKRELKCGDDGYIIGKSEGHVIKMPFGEFEALLNEYAQIYYKQQTSLRMGELTNFYVSNDKIEHDVTLYEVLTYLKQK